MIDSRQATATALAIAAIAAAGCGGSDEPEAPPRAAQTAEAPAAAGVPAVPAGLSVAESAAEDIIDLALSGDRAGVVEKARLLDDTAQRQAPGALRSGGVPAPDIAQFQARAAEVARLAPGAPLLKVAIASNRAFGMIPGFLARFRSDVPAAVSQLDYLDFEAKLQATARDEEAFASAVELLSSAWQQVRLDVEKAGGSAAADRFSAHVKAMAALRKQGAAADRAKEAQRGLDLVDELEAVYR